MIVKHTTSSQKIWKWATRVYMIYALVSQMFFEIFDQDNKL